MAHHPGNIQGYNNEIVIAGSDAVIGCNPGINESEQISKTKGDTTFKGKITPQARTVHRGPQPEENAAATAETATLSRAAEQPPPTPRKTLQETRRVEQQSQETRRVNRRTEEAHEGEK